MDEKIECLVILEMLGRPKEHIEGTIKNLVDEIGKEDGVKIVEKKIADAKEVDNEKFPGHQGLFSTFADLNLECGELYDLLVIMFKYMPSHVEITKPENMKISNDSLNNFFNELMRRLHQYDEIAKGASMERDMLIRKLREVDPEFDKLISEQLAQKAGKEKVVKKGKKGKKK